MRDYDFSSQLKISQGVCKVDAIPDLLNILFPGKVSVERAGESEDRKGTDYWVRYGSGRSVSIDVKVRTEDWSTVNGSDDLALETWSIVGESPGWTRNHDKRTDYVLWYWSGTGRFCLLPFHLLCLVFSRKWQEWSLKFGTFRQNSGKWQSECVFVPRNVVWREIYQACNGNF